MHHDPSLLTGSVPAGGRVRVSASVLDSLVTVAASDVQGVLHTESAIGGALVGGLIGGVAGFVQAGPAGAAVGASVGSAAGVAAGQLVHNHRSQQRFATLDGTALPELSVRVVARYGEDLTALADRVRRSVEQALREALGLEPGLVCVEIVDVVDPALSARLTAPTSAADSPGAAS